MADGIFGQTPNNIKQILECISGTEVNVMTLTSKFLGGKFNGTAYTSNPTSYVDMNKVGDYIEVQITVGGKTLPPSSNITTVLSSSDEAKNLLMVTMNGWSSDNTAASYKETIKVNGIQVYSANCTSSWYNTISGVLIPAGVKAGDIITCRIECTSVPSKYNCLGNFPNSTNSLTKNQNLSWDYLVSLMF